MLLHQDVAIPGILPPLWIIAENNLCGKEKLMILLVQQDNLHK